jgi:hypothetical protein
VLQDHQTNAVFDCRGVYLMVLQHLLMLHTAFIDVAAFIRDLAAFN